MESTEIVVLEIAGEGGSMALVGRRNGNDTGWEFAKKVASDNWMLVEEGEVLDPEHQPPPLEWLGRWDAAIGLIDRYPWAILVPVKVHPEFKQDILVEVTHRLISEHPKYVSIPEDLKRRAMERWLSKCR